MNKSHPSFFHLFFKFLHSYPDPHPLQIHRVRCLFKQVRQTLQQPYEEIDIAIATMANVNLHYYNNKKDILDAVQPIHMTLAFIATFDADEEVHYDGIRRQEVPVPPAYYRDQDGAPIIPPLVRTPRGRPSHQDQRHLE